MLPVLLCVFQIRVHTPPLERYDTSTFRVLFGLPRSQPCGAREASDNSRKTQFGTGRLTVHCATRATNPFTGQNSAGFGYINTAVLPLNSNPRQGTLVARFQF